MEETGSASLFAAGDVYRPADRSAGPVLAIPRPAYATSGMRLPPETIDRLSPFVHEQDLVRLRAVTSAPGRWLPALLGVSATTVAPFVCFRRASFDPSTPRGLALIAHEAHHLGQVREMGWLRFYLRYFIGQFRSGFRHAGHPFEIPAIELQRFVKLELEDLAGPVRRTEPRVSTPCARTTETAIPSYD